MKFFDRLTQTYSFIGASVFGYLTGSLYIKLSFDAILNPTYDYIAGATWIIGFAMIFINLPFIFISLLATIFEYFNRAKKNLFKETKTNAINIIKNIIFVIGFLLLFIPFPLFIILL